MNSKLKIALIIVVVILILFSETAILGVISSREDPNSFFSPLGIVPTYSYVTTAKNGLEIRDYRITNWTSRNVMAGHAGVPPMYDYTLDLSVTLYSFSNNTFDCYAQIKGENGGIGTSDRSKIKHGENTLEITGSGFSSNSPRFSLSLMEANHDTFITAWLVQDIAESNLGSPVYKGNMLFPDEQARVFNGNTFVPEKLQNTALYFWIPTLVLFFTGYLAYRLRKWSRINQPSDKQTHMDKYLTT